MSATKLVDVTQQIQKFWSSLFMEELRAKTLIAGLVNKDYEGQIRAQGDTVKVSQINAIPGQNRTVGTDADSFTTNPLTTSYVDVKADRRAVAAVEVEDLVQLQSQIQIEQNGGPASPLRLKLVESIDKIMNDYIYSLVAPSTASPDHLLGSVSDFNKAALLNVRKAAAAAKWDKTKGWWMLCDPSYYNDLLSDTTMTSKDYIKEDAPTVGGQIVDKRFGFNILEDDGLAVDQALAFHPDFLHLVKQTEVRFKVSDLHSNNKFAHLISADIVYGAKLGIDGAKKHILTNAGSATGVVIA